MSLPDRSYWRDPEYWRWWWRERLSSGDKLLLALAAAVVALIGGIITADWLSYDDTSETLTVPVISTVGASRSGDQLPSRGWRRTDTSGVARSGSGRDGSPD